MRCFNEKKGYCKGEPLRKLRNTGYILRKRLCTFGFICGNFDADNMCIYCIFCGHIRISTVIFISSRKYTAYGTGGHRIRRGNNCRNPLCFGNRNRKCGTDLRICCRMVGIFCTFSDFGSNRRLRDTNEILYFRKNIAVFHMSCHYIYPDENNRYNIKVKK